MKKQNVLKFARTFALSLGVASFMLTSCNKYDDGELRGKIDVNTEAIAANAAAIKTLEGLVGNGKWVTGVEKTADGLKITLSDGTTETLKGFEADTWTIENDVWCLNGVPTEFSSKGSDGSNGLKGDKGDAGEQGEQGIAGAAGVDGLPGEDGDTWTIVGDFWAKNGEVTEFRAIGTNGTDGSNGADGADGAQGVQGPAGIQGVPGDSWAIVDGMWVKNGDLETAVPANPKMGVDAESFLTVSYDGGLTYVRIIPETCVKGNDGTNGNDGADAINPTFAIVDGNWVVTVGEVVTTVGPAYVTGRSPIIGEGGEWMVWDDKTNAFVKSGKMALSTVTMVEDGLSYIVMMPDANGKLQELILPTLAGVEASILAATPVQGIESMNFIPSLLVDGNPVLEVITIIGTNNDILFTNAKALELKYQLNPSDVKSIEGVSFKFNNRDVASRANIDVTTISPVNPVLSAKGGILSMGATFDADYLADMSAYNPTTKDVFTLEAVISETKSVFSNEIAIEKTMLRCSDVKLYNKDNYVTGELSYFDISTTTAWSKKTGSVVIYNKTLDLDGIVSAYVSSRYASTHTFDALGIDLTYKFELAEASKTDFMLSNDNVLSLKNNETYVPSTSAEVIVTVTVNSDVKFTGKLFVKSIASTPIESELVTVDKGDINYSSLYVSSDIPATTLVITWDDLEAARLNSGLTLEQFKDKYSVNIYNSVSVVNGDVVGDLVELAKVTKGSDEAGKIAYVVSIPTTDAMFGANVWRVVLESKDNEEPKVYADINVNIEFNIVEPAAFELNPAYVTSEKYQKVSGSVEGGKFSMETSLRNSFKERLEENFDGVYKSFVFKLGEMTTKPFAAVNGTDVNATFDINVDNGLELGKDIKYPMILVVTYDNNQTKEYTWNIQFVDPFKFEDAPTTMVDILNGVSVAPKGVLTYGTTELYKNGVVGTGKKAPAAFGIYASEIPAVGTPVNPTVEYSNPVAVTNGNILELVAINVTESQDLTLVKVEGESTKVSWISSTVVVGTIDPAGMVQTSFVLLNGDHTVVYKRYVSKDKIVISPRL